MFGIRIYLFILLLVSVVSEISAQELQSVDTLPNTTDTVVAKKRNLYQKVVHYFEESNKPPSNKKLDFSFIGGPSYSNDTKLSIGLLGAALYKSRFGDSLTSLSNATLYSEFSITGFYLFGIKGSHFAPGDKYRINYKVYFNSFPSYFWGIGYETARHDSNETDYLLLNSKLNASLEFQPLRNLYVGPAIGFNYSKAGDNDQWDLWDGQRLRTINYGVGFNFFYDSRDFMSNAYCGWYAGFEQRFYPRFLANKYCFSSTEFTVSHYFGAWRDAIIACQAHAMFTYGNTPWSMLATFGGSHSMRGYYEGRYRDKNEIDACVELRQHVWHRNSVVAWVGAGTVFPTFSELHSRQILPNFGIGYRWEFKKRVNVRLDLGFGKGETGVVFNLNEAF